MIDRDLYRASASTSTAQPADRCGDSSLSPASAESSKRFRRLPRALQPRAITLKLAVEQGLIERAERELDRRAEQDANGCFGYFPALVGAPDIFHDLPESLAFAERLPSIDVEGQRLFFNFLRRSRVKQCAQAALHLDSDAKTALTGDPSSLQSRLVLRLLLNLSATFSRSFTYADIDTSSVLLETRGGYVCCRGPIAIRMLRAVTLAPRLGPMTQGVLIYTNRVLHSGADDENGHFVAGFGREDPVR